GSVHLTQFPEVNPEYLDARLAHNWSTMIALRGEISRALETARKNKVVGHSLDARVDISPPDNLRSFMEMHREDLKTLLILSQVNITDKDEIKDPYVSEEFPGLTIGVTKAQGKKCDRCWIYSETVGADPDHPTICERCRMNL
ncbi:MAG TPA: isoleucine--tRNA ligase, partial [Syntrophaceae bacterium]|nr:isoleucine--tRNA ligase [Syntrophaceae bacterium]